MTIEYFPFDNQPSFEVQWRDMMTPMKTTGIVAEGEVLSTFEGDCLVDTGTGLQIQIYPGKAWIKGHLFKHTGDPVFLPINANTSGATRTDFVVIRADFVNNTMSYQVLQGSITPVQNANTWDLPLAAVGIPNNASDASAFTFTDYRVLAVASGLVPSIKRFNNNISIPSAAYTSINLSGGFEWQTHEAMYPGSDPTRVYAPQDGFYVAYGRVTFAGGAAAGRRGVRISSNTGVVTINQLYTASAALDVSCQGVTRLLAGDEVQLFALQDSAGNMTLSNAELVLHFLTPLAVG